ncbi:hypothetical protein Y013_01725 [Rhodococcus pyridinivorans SB3094]|uniref:Uncharacterized protein n=1 Tax=Rhodococcus pyridinivorans SB3094 TaxID=1435356 RepID=V9XQC2_9NOCA|nr:hypothetical protein Y013_01725 [Rhodococcus pyridinivorans SB3094]
MTCLLIGGVSQGSTTGEAVEFPSVSEYHRADLH